MQEIGRVEHCSIHAHGIHIGQPGLGIARPGIGRVRSLGVEASDLGHGHAGLPHGMPRDARTVQAAYRGPVQEDFVRDRIAEGPEPGAGEGAVLGFQVLRPDGGCFKDVAIRIDDRIACFRIGSHWGVSFHAKK